MNIKKISSSIPKRLIITLFLIALQLFLIFATVTSLSEHFIWIYRIAVVASIVTVIYIINSRSNQSYKILWLVFILVLPILGVLCYMLWGGGRVLPHIKRNMSKCTKKYMSYLPDDHAETESLKYNNLFHSRQAQFLKNESGYPLYQNTESKYYSPCEAVMGDLLNMLRRAKKYIFIEFFILGEGTMWDEIYEILTDKAKNGVEVKVIFDDFGSIAYQNKNFIKRFAKYGIKISAFNRVTPSVNIFMNNRNHRKIIIVDGEYALTGGMNISDEYINRKEKFGYWMDNAIILHGPAVQSFLSMFCSMWEFITKEKIDFFAHKCNYFDPITDGYYLPYCDDPLNRKNPAEGIYMQILNSAQKYVYITTPYLILDSTMTDALCLAAKSNIDVRIVVPHIPDKWYVHPVTQYYYNELLEAGVKIYEYAPGFIHSKMFLSDDSVATVGTINMDYRSFYFHFECGVWMSQTDSINQIKDNFKDLFAASNEIKINNWKKRPIRYKLMQEILHLFAPLM